MEKLKSILADKILDLSTENGDLVKAKIDKIQRFRDFANACQTLMIKYPQIEEELIAMVKADDYDTKVASSRVDSVIRMSDAMATQPQQIQIPMVEESCADTAEEVIEVLETVADEQEKEIDANEEFVNKNIIEENSVEESIGVDFEKNAFEDDTTEYLDTKSSNIEDVDFEIIDTTTEEDGEESEEIIETETFINPDITSDSETEDQIKDQEESEPETVIGIEESVSEPELSVANIVETEDTDELSEEEINAAKRKKIIKRVLQLLVITLAVVILIFIINFVRNNWQTVLIVLGVALVMLLGVWYLKRKLK